MVGGRIKSNVRVKEAAAVCEFLSQASVFKGLTPTQLADVAERMRRAKFAAGTAIVRQGEAGDKFYLIRTRLGGRADAHRPTAREQQVADVEGRRVLRRTGID